MSLIVKLTEKKGFSTAESKIADYIIANKEEILHLTVRELAKATYTGSSTVMRVVKKVYDGSFSDFKVDLAYEFHNVRNSEQKIQFQIQKQETAFSVMDKIARVEKDIIDQTRSLQDYQQIERVTKLINEAIIIYVFADGINEQVGHEFKYMMARIGKAVDGVISKESRVSFAKDKDEQWLEVDLGKVENISHFVINYESQVPAFKIQVAGKDQLSQFEAGNKNGNITKKDYEELEKTYKDYLDLAKGEKISDEEIGRLLKEVTELNDSIEGYVIYSKDELNELYQSMLAYEEKDYTKDSFAGFKDQLNTLKDAIDQADDYQKVNDVLKQLKELDSTLVKLDRSKLEKVIKKYQELKEEDYTVDSWQQMKEILYAAQAVYDNPSLNQEDIDQAIASFDGIQLVQRGNVDKLEELLASIKESDYTVVSWAQFDSIYQEAKQMVNDSCNVDQKDVDEMIEKVKDSMQLLVKAGNIDDYQEAVDKVNSKVG